MRSGRGDRHSETPSRAHGILERVGALSRDLRWPLLPVGVEERGEEDRPRHDFTSVTFGERVDLSPREVSVRGDEVEKERDRVHGSTTLVRRVESYTSLLTT